MPPTCDWYRSIRQYAGYEKVKPEAERRHVELVIVPTSEAIRLLENDSAANAILHLTC
jgi:hypothetical protein